MSLNIGIYKPKNVSKWVEYKDEEGNVLAEFKVRGIGYKSYQVAIERASNQVATKGYNVEYATSEDKLYHELLLEAAACHLIEDWKGISFAEDGVEKEVPFTTENSKKLFAMGDLAIVIWHFIKKQSEDIQREADGFKNEVLGKLNSSTSGQSTETTEQPTEL